ncbi:uncharacterized protein LOC124459156 isoform X2 [Xenia sp. Carnegie-2017]|uniref:uncharacterized protein LOC124459156 isoform X2 n=1 Tax=Xenia sp. Carnegie-2017 TaxID=2897299 RepID=UPI001F04B2FE|nr:uncharacterized protein LOC124459156 isoform X2 [Xenia sp. Carnegie-2017]
MIAFPHGQDSILFQFNDFCKENLFSDDKDIYKKIKKNNIRTFTTKAITVKDSKGQQLAVKSSRNLFAKLLVLSTTRNVDLKELLSFSLSEFPLSLATPTGGFVKTAKSKMFEVMETLGDKSVLVDVQSLPEKSTALLVDAMAVLQVIKGKWKTFGDRYPEISIKNTERAHRASVQGVQTVHIFNDAQKIPKQWKKFMSSGKNKESLMAFLANQWRTYPSSFLRSLACLYITSRDKCICLTLAVSKENPIISNNVPELESDHEEADTRLLLHSKHSAQTYDRIIIKTPDTDVLVISIAMQKLIGKDIYLLTGTGSNTRTIDIGAVSDELGDALCKCLPGFHAFTGNNS